MSIHEQARPHPTETAVVSSTVAAYSRSASGDAASALRRAREVAAKARQNGWVVDALFAESRSQGISDQMLEKLATYDVVMVADISRLARGAARSREILQRFRDADVRLIVDGEPVSGTDVASIDEVVRQLSLAARETQRGGGEARIAATRARLGEQG